MHPYHPALRVRLTLCLLVGVMAGGCLKKDTASTWYVEADRRVVWTVEERDVRSDDSSLEEQDYVMEVRRTSHAVARALRQFTPTQLTARLLRERPPFHVVTDATFPNLQVLGERLLTRFGLRGRSFVAFTREGFEWTWTIDADSVFDQTLLDEDLASLFDAPDIRIVLSEGRFLSNLGDDVTDSRIARFPIRSLIDAHNTRGNATTFVLAWAAR